MKPKIMGRFLIAAALLVGAGVAGAADKKAAVVPESDAALANNVRHEIVMYPYFSIWDDININVDHGNVTLTGEVNLPVKREDIDRLTRNLPGVTHLQNDIRVLPASFQDDRLRLRLARAIYGDPSMMRYANQPLLPIHILVENGHVTLTGVVDSQFDKQIAGTRAATAGMSFGPIVNNLQVEHTAKKS